MPSRPVPAGDGGPRTPTLDPSIAIRGEILSRAASMLDIPYVWGGNSTTMGMDCSAWASRVWGAQRYSTDSIWNISHPISKDDLRPGDALNLTTGRDPERLGHIRLFEAWANVAHTVMWVYEATPPRSVHRVVVYDDRYQPIRLAGSFERRVGAHRSRHAGARTDGDTADPKPTPRPTVRPTPRPTVKITPRPTAKPTTQTRPTPTPSPIAR